MMSITLFFLVPVLSTALTLSNSVQEFLKKYDQVPTPVVLWHGMGDSCCSPGSMGRIIKILEKNIDNVYVHSIQIGDGFLADVEHSYFGNVNDQVNEVCQTLRANEKLKDGYHAIGFSQGAQFLRAVAQRCSDPPMKNLVSIGGQHQGVFGLPRCPASSDVCDKIRRLLEIGAYVGFVQKSLVQAQYWHDPYAERDYRENSIFLADINNENTVNKTYKTNLLKLKNLVLVKFLNDSMVVPKESEWFEFYDENDTSKITPLEKTVIYTEDRLGLQTLQESKRLHLIAFEGDHLQISDSLFVSQIVNKFLR